MTTPNTSNTSETPKTITNAEAYHELKHIKLFLETVILCNNAAPILTDNKTKIVINPLLAPTAQDTFKVPPFIAIANEPQNENSDKENSQEPIQAVEDNNS